VLLLNVTAILDIDPPYYCAADTEAVNVPESTSTVEGQLDIVTVGGGRTTDVFTEVVAVWLSPEVYVAPIE